jgi:hypothetical protein
MSRYSIIYKNYSVIVIAREKISSPLHFAEIKKSKVGRCSCGSEAQNERKQLAVSGLSVDSAPPLDSTKDEGKKSVLQ